MKGRESCRRHSPPGTCGDPACKRKKERDTHRVSETRKKDIFIALSQKRESLLEQSTNTHMYACADAREDERLLESFTEQQRGGFVPLDWKLDD